MIADLEALLTSSTGEGMREFNAKIAAKLPAILTALRAAEALLKAQSVMGGILVCANPQHLPLRHPLCNRCQIDTRFEELEDALAALGEGPR